MERCRATDAGWRTAVRGVALGEDSPPLATQLNDLGRQALAQGASAMAQTFFQKALQLDPGNAEATRGLKASKAARDNLLRVALQDPVQPPAARPAAPRLHLPLSPASGPGRRCRPAGYRCSGRTCTAAANTPQVPGATAPRATLEGSTEEENIARQQLVNDVEQRLQTARNQVAANQPEAALTNLRLAQNLVRSATDVSESVRRSSTGGSRRRCRTPSATRSGSSPNGPSTSAWPRPPISGPAALTVRHQSGDHQGHDDPV